MISPKMLFILLVLIYVTPSHEEDPEIETKSFSIKDAKMKLKRLIDRKFKKVLNNGEKVKTNLSFQRRGRYLKGNVSELERAIDKLAFAINTAASDYYKKERINLYNTMLKVLNTTRDDVEEQYEKLYKDAKNLLDAADIYWRKQWDAAIDLLISGVELGFNPKS